MWELDLSNAAVRLCAPWHIPQDEVLSRFSVHVYTEWIKDQSHRIPWSNTVQQLWQQMSEASFLRDSHSHTLPTYPIPTHILRTDEQITLMFSSSLKYKCPKTDMLFSPESVYKLMRLSQEQRSPGRVLGRGAGGTWDEKSTVPLPSSGSLPGILLPVSSQPCPTLPLSTPHVREEQKGAKAREPLSPRVMEFQNLMTSWGKVLQSKEVGFHSCFLAPHWAGRLLCAILSRSLRSLPRTRNTYR